MGSRQGLLLAVLAGICAACASLCAKLAMSGDEITAGCHRIIDIIPLPIDKPCYLVSWIVRAAIFSLTFIFNGLMWTLFTKSLQLCQSSLHATMTNSSANLIFSGLTGQLLFGEKLSLKWWTGTSFILLGLLLVNRGQQSQNQTIEDKKER